MIHARNVSEQHIRTEMARVDFERCLYALGRLTSGDNLCYANAAFQCVFTWRPFVALLESFEREGRPRVSSERSGIDVRCVSRRLIELFEGLKGSGLSASSKVKNFMSWVFELPGVALRRGAMEDPHDFLVPLFQKMSAVGGSIEVCGINCSLWDFHTRMLSVGVCVKLDYVCCECGASWTRADNGYAWCVSLCLPCSGAVDVARLLDMHSVNGVLDTDINDTVNESRPCGCSRGVRVRHILECTDDTQGKCFAVHANGVYYMMNNGNCLRRRFTDRWCVPSLHVTVAGKVYILDSVIVHISVGVSTDVGHYIAYVRLSSDGSIWKVCDDQRGEWLVNWAEVSDVHGHIFFYSV